MKRKNIIAFSVALMAIGAFTSCSDEFLQDKKNYDYVDASTYNTFSGAKARVDDIYAWCLPNASSEPSWKYNSTGAADLQSKSTEEYSGFGSFVDPDAPMTSQSGNNTVPDYFHNSGNNIQASVWGRIRNCNDVIYGIENSTLSEEEKNELLGQVYFFRAWCYYNLVKWYGGVPIITEVQEPVAGAITPRSTTKACVNFICEDLERSAQLLAPFTENGGWPSSDFGRVTSGTALALKGRTLLLYASPLFNRKNDVERWRKAYNEITADLPRINACGYGLVNEGNAGTNASGWANVFSMVDGNTEAVFVTLYNDIATGGVPDFSKNNSWFQDGTRVYINSDSWLKYPKKFGLSKREVFLVGEAYFVVAKNKKRPFIVNLNGPSVHVLGTSFDVQAYPENKDIVICLDEGHVNLTLSSAKEYPLLPGEKLIYNKESDQCRIIKNDHSKQVSMWKDNVISFKDTPLTEVVKVLNRWYNVNFKIEDEQASKYVYTLTSDNTILEKVLQDLEKIAPVKFEYDEVRKEVTVRMKQDGKK